MRRSNLGQQITTLATLLATGALLLGVVTTRFTKDEPPKDGTPKLPAKITGSFSDAELFKVFEDYKQLLVARKTTDDDTDKCKQAEKILKKRMKRETDPSILRAWEVTSRNRNFCPSPRDYNARGDSAFYSQILYKSQSVALVP